MSPSLAPPSSEAIREASPTLAEDVRARVLARLADDATVEPGDRVAVRRSVARALAAEGIVVAPAVWARMVRDLVDELVGLGPVEVLLRDPLVTDVCCNGPGEVWVERSGALQRTDVAFRDEAAMVATIRRVVAGAGARLDRAVPCVDALLPSGVRLHAAVPPVTRRPVLTLRRIATIVPTWDDLVGAGTVDSAGAHVLVEAVRARHSIVVCGPAGAGKTTLLSRLLAEVGDDRVVVLEDTPELSLASSHVVALAVVPAGPDGGGVDLRTLVRQALRMRPDRIVVGEVRGAEVADLLQAMNTGHAGSATTVHANSASDGLVRLEGMALLAGIPLAAATAQVDAAVDVVVCLDRLGGRRRVAEIMRVERAGAGRRLRPLWRP